MTTDKYTNWFFQNFHNFYKFNYFLYKRYKDRNELKWAKNYIKEGMTVVDIGANIGSYSLILSDLVGESGKVYAFEPDEENISFLKKNTKNKKNITIEKMAVGDKTGKINLYLAKDRNVDHHTYKTKDSRSTKIIRCVKLDDYFKKNQKIDLIKIDVQGSDYFAIKGSMRLIRAQKNIAILGEYWPFGLNNAGINPEDYIKLLKSLGLKVRIDKKSFDKNWINNKDLYTNFIAYK